MINRSAENEQDRRRFLRAAGMTGLGVVGAGAPGGLIAGPPPRPRRAASVMARS
jgi:hypothetical protein